MKSRSWHSLLTMRQPELNIPIINSLFSSVRLDQLRVDVHIVDVAGFLPGNRRTYDILYACHTKHQGRFSMSHGYRPRGGWALFCSVNAFPPSRANCAEFPRTAREIHLDETNDRDEGFVI